jgi:hypothetical protein
MAAPRLGNSCGANRGLDRLRKRLLVNMVPTFFAATWVNRAPAGRKDILPTPFAASIRLFAFERERQIYLAKAFSPILFMQHLNFFQMPLERLAEAW